MVNARVLELGVGRGWQGFEVRWVHAEPCLAAMVNMMVDGDRPDEQLVAGAVSVNGAAPHADDSVTRSIGAALPQPAPVCVNLKSHAPMVLEP